MNGDDKTALRTASRLNVRAHKKISVFMREENRMGRALGLWLLGVPVFVIILLYLFGIM